MLELSVFQHGPIASDNHISLPSHGTFQDAVVSLIV